MLESGCIPHHDWFTAVLTFGLCCGLVLSYVPQHYRIIHEKSSEGLSPWYLLLGTASAASAMWNLITLQWPILRCCGKLSLGSCVEMTAGVTLVTLQWSMFTLIFVLYMIYYPSQLKYISTDADLRHLIPPKVQQRTSEWNLSIVLFWVAGIHFLVLFVTTFYLMLTATLSPILGEPLPSTITSWATFLGLCSALFATIQYTPQIVHTYKMKLVGALSIPMMCIQTPGAIFMITSIALRPGTNWTSWITFAVAGVMQGTLLTMCILWKVRQQRLGIDDFGNPINPPLDTSIPGLVVEQDGPLVVTTALEAALEVDTPVQDIDEQTPLLFRTNSELPQKPKSRWWSWSNSGR
ncbi:hypothetical protein BDN72DRAFT_870083 [Pluteus cervinus]|uniref:Uncharacterized protein n=1 Tax=Pluteus cervinus TaxID=181527 RepID=A0ACD3B0P3_9AGAR|nr:hypothetical protein BDN72DRAFT_870083 [Pluteus cervinus]